MQSLPVLLLVQLFVGPCDHLRLGASLPCTWSNMAQHGGLPVLMLVQLFVGPYDHLRLEASLPCTWSNMAEHGGYQSYCWCSSLWDLMITWDWGPVYHAPEVTWHSMGGWGDMPNFMLTYTCRNKHYTPVHLVESVEKCGLCMTVSCMQQLCARFVMTPVPGIKLCTIAAYRLFHSHAQVLTFTDSRRWTGV